MPVWGHLLALLSPCMHGVCSAQTAGEEQRAWTPIQPLCAGGPETQLHVWSLSGQWTLQWTLQGETRRDAFAEGDVAAVQGRFDPGWSDLGLTDEKSSAAAAMRLLSDDSVLYLLYHSLGPDREIARISAYRPSEPRRPLARLGKAPCGRRTAWSTVSPVWACLSLQGWQMHMAARVIIMTRGYKLVNRRVEHVVQLDYQPPF